MIYKPPSDHDQFYKWVGLCISRWSYTEDILFSLCQRVLRTSDEITAIVYFRTPTIEARINLTDELLRAELPKPPKKNGGHPHFLVKQWNDIKLELRPLLEFRNALAHHQVRYRFSQPEFHVAIEQEDGSYGPLVTVPSPLIISHSSKQAARKRKDAEPLSQNDMEQHYKTLETARDKLQQFRLALLAWQQKERLRKSR